MFSAAAPKARRPFKDYCFIMQVHPDADAGVVDAAYWYLAKRYSEEAMGGQAARAKVDELNEAYSVLGSPDRREEYLRLRAAVLGEGALPVPPSPPPSRQPLSVMERQRPLPRGVAEADQPRVALPQIQSLLGISILLITAVAALMAGAPSTAIVGFLALALPLSTAPLWRPWLHPRVASPDQTSGGDSPSRG